MSLRFLSAVLCLLGLTITFARAETAAPASAKTPFSDGVLAQAMKEEAPRWKFLPGVANPPLKPVFALHMTAVAAHLAPDRVINGQTLAASVVAKLHTILDNVKPDTEGHTREPDAVGGIAGWSHNAFAQTLLLARRTPAIWSSLKPAEQHRSDLIMQALATTGSLLTGDENDYHTRIDGIGLQHKSWNPNIAEGYVDIMVAASLYFGADTLQQFLINFDFDTFITQLKEAGLTNIARCWTYNPAMKDLFMHGGLFLTPITQVQGIPTSIPGQGKGVRRIYSYRGRTLDRPWEIYRTQADRMYAKAVRTIVVAHAGNESRLLQRVSKATRSPWEGRMGMCYELESMDSLGTRTSIVYAYEGLMINLPTSATLRVLGFWPDDISGHDIETRMSVGVADELFRAKEGYRGWANGKEIVAWLEKDLQPIGSDYIFPLWSELFAGPPPVNP